MNFEKLNKMIVLNNYELIHIKSTNSTMNEVKNFLEKKNKNCIIIADKQTSGRGQRNKTWESPVGNFYCSISFDDILKINENYLYGVLIAISVKDTLQKFNAKNIYFKWPNDIFYENKKFCGIITESFRTNNKKNFMVLGFGININNSPQIKNYPTTHIKAFCKFENYYSFVFSFFENFFDNLNNLLSKKNNLLIEKYKKNLLFFGKKIKIKLHDNSIIHGVFKEINSDGSLLLQQKEKFINIYNGSIVL